MARRSLLCLFALAWAGLAAAQGRAVDPLPAAPVVPVAPGLAGAPPLAAPAIAPGPGLAVAPLALPAPSIRAAVAAGAGVAGLPEPAALALPAGEPAVASALAARSPAAAAVRPGGAARGADPAESEQAPAALGSLFDGSGAKRRGEAEAAPRQAQAQQHPQASAHAPAPAAAPAGVAPQARPAPSGGRRARARPGQAPGGGRRVYLLPQPIDVRARLGVVAKALHYFAETAYQALKALAVYHMTGEPWSALGFFIVEAPKIPPMIGAQSLADLRLRYLWRERAILRRIARAPGVERIRVLAGTHTEFQGVVASRQQTRGAVILEASEPLGAEDVAGYGAPMPIADLEGTRLELRLSVDGRSSELAWDASLKDLLDRRPIPAEVRRRWREELERAGARRSLVARLLNLRAPRADVAVSLVEPGGGVTGLGTVTQGKATRALLGLGWAARLRRAPRALPLADIVVEERGASKRSWTERLRAAPGRLWDRLRGRLVVVDR